MKKKKIYLSFKDRYNAPTPAKIKKIADALLASVNFGAASSFMTQYDKLGATLAIIGIVCTFASNFFCEEK